jgi:hypothetical protein
MGLNKTKSNEKSKSK